MTDGSRRRPSALFVRASLLVAASALTYYATLGVFHRPEFVASWLGPVWLAVTYGIVGVMFVASDARVTRTKDRRGVSRVPVALPVRYSTEEGEVGVGVLVDLTQHGAGLLVPHGAVDADRVWLQFLGFDDSIAVQGRVMYAHQAEGTTRLGLALEPLLSETKRLLSELVIPSGYETLVHLREPASGGSARPAGQSKHGRERTERGYHMPVLVEQGAISLWAVTQAASEEGAVLLLPQSLPSVDPIRVSTWGKEDARQCHIVKSEVLTREPFQISRVVVRHDPAPVPVPIGEMAAVSSAPRSRHAWVDRAGI